MMQRIVKRLAAAAVLALVPAAIGFLLGLVPLVTGFVKGKVRLGIFGLIASTLSGALLGVILSIPAMAIFTWLIVRDGFVADDVASDAPAANSDDDQD